MVFDLDRLEVLRGPQGTLFGAGSEGGTVRFITQQPSLDAVKVYGRAEGAATQHGAASGEGGVSISAPIIAGKLETGAARRKVHAAPGSIPRCNRPDKIGIAGI